MKKTLQYLLLFCTILSSSAAYAGNDTGLGIELEGNFKIIKPLELAVVGELRTQEGLSNAERFSLGLNLTYKPFKMLKTDVGYLLLQRHTLAEQTSKYNYTSYWTPRHRFYASLTGSFKPYKQLEISLRERIQYTYDTRHFATRYLLSDPTHRVTDKEVGGEGTWLLRTRMQAKWSISKKSPFSPYASVEMLNDAQASLAIDQMRYTVGTDYKFNKHNSLDISYRYKDKNNSDENKGHLITISYSHAF